MPDQLFPELESASERQRTDREVEALVTIYAAAQVRIRRLLTQIAYGTPLRWNYEALIVAIDGEIILLDRAVRKWAGESIPYAYGVGRKSVADVAAGYGIGERVRIFGSAVSLEDMRVIRQQVVADLTGANSAMKKELTRHVRERQQAAVMARMVTESLEDEMTPPPTTTVAQQLASSENIANEQWVVAGGRHYTPAYYATMVAGIWTHQAVLRGAVLASLEHGLDLVQWAVRPGACPICLTHAGRVYSITGSAVDFPPLVERPPRHIHCRCNLIPVTRSLLASRGILTQLSALSLNSPKFNTERDARLWLIANPQMRVESLDDLRRVLSTFS